MVAAQFSPATYSAAFVHTIGYPASQFLTPVPHFLQIGDLVAGAATFETSV